MKKIILIITVVFLNGCVEKSRFDCPYGKGPTCASMETIDKMIKSDNVTKINTNSCAKNNCNSSNIGENTKSTKNISPAEIDKNSALRIPEEIMQLWIAPYESSNGIYYNQSYVTIIVKDAIWRGPVLDDLSGREKYNG